MRIFVLHSLCIFNTPRYRLPAHAWANKMPFLRLIYLASNEYIACLRTHCARLCHFEVDWLRAYRASMEGAAQCQQHMSARSRVMTSWSGFFFFFFQTLGDSASSSVCQRHRHYYHFHTSSPMCVFSLLNSLAFGFLHTSSPQPQRCSGGQGGESELQKSTTSEREREKL